MPRIILWYLQEKKIILLLFVWMLIQFMEKLRLPDFWLKIFHCYALAYQYYNGDRDIITSYYLQSVKWLFESLKYAENSPESQINILVSLRYRYNDIMTYSEPKSEQWERAKLLSDALDEIIEERK